MSKYDKVVLDHIRAVELFHQEQWARALRLLNDRPIRVDNPEVLFCGKCGRPMAVCRKGSIRCSALVKKSK